MSFFKPIHHTFGPHVTWQYVLLSALIGVVPWKWKNGGSTEQLREHFSRVTELDVFLFGSGRDGLLALLQSLDLQQGDEIIIQGFTCMVLPNAIHQAGAKAVYCDIDPETLNVDIEDLVAKITPQTRAIICQHTFGIPADIAKLRELCDQYQLALIEDCAHIIPDANGPENVGHHGDFVLLSFGRDKALSGVAGGAILSRHSFVSQKLALQEEKAVSFSFWHILALIKYAPTYFVARPLYATGIGKALLVLMRSLKLLVPVLTEEEKHGITPSTLHTLPNACAFLVLQEWKHLKSINDHRRDLTDLYRRAAERNQWRFPSAIQADMPLQKFPIFVENANNVREALRENNIHLHDGWTDSVVCPPSVNPLMTHYKPGSAAQAEYVATHILSLPTHPTMTEKQARELVEELHSKIRVLELEY